MKKLWKVLLLSLCLTFVFAVGCTQQPDNSGTDDSSQQSPQTEYCTVTFMQTGYENIVKRVEKGKALEQNDIPTSARLQLSFRAAPAYISSRYLLPCSSSERGIWK